MLMKMMKILLPCVMLILIIGISFNYYVLNKEMSDIICHKNKLLIQIESGTPIYTKVKGISCEVEKGILIIEEQS